MAVVAAAPLVIAPIRSVEQRVSIVGPKLHILICRRCQTVTHTSTHPRVTCERQNQRTEK